MSTVNFPAYELDTVPLVPHSAPVSGSEGPSAVQSTNVNRSARQYHTHECPDDLEAQNDRGHGQETTRGSNDPSRATKVTMSILLGVAGLAMVYGMDQVLSPTHGSSGSNTSAYSIPTSQVASVTTDWPGGAATADLPTPSLLTSGGSLGTVATPTATGAFTGSEEGGALSTATQRPLTANRSSSGGAFTTLAPGVAFGNDDLSSKLSQLSAAGESASAIA